MTKLPCGKWGRPAPDYERRPAVFSALVLLPLPQGRGGPEWICRCPLPTTALLSSPYPAPRVELGAPLCLGLNFSGFVLFDSSPNLALIRTRQAGTGRRLSASDSLLQCDTAFAFPAV